MIIKTLAVGSMLANCYLVWCDATREALVIDPGGEARKILAEIAKERLQVKYIVNTHGHVDHIAANAEVRSATGAQLMIHTEDAPLLNNSNLNLALLVGMPLDGLQPDVLLNDGDEITCGEQVRLKVLHTPGHTRGGICLQAGCPGCAPTLQEGTRGAGAVIFTGDTLFEGSIGRTDFPGGSYQALIDSIKNKILPLEDSCLVYPGHGPASTVGYEREHNPYLE